MSFVYQLTTEEMREKMFAFLKPVYLKSHASHMPSVYDIHDINWTFGVYDPENGIFLTFLSREFRKSRRDNVRYNRDRFSHYIVSTDQGNLFSVAKKEYSWKELEIPGQFQKLSEIIENGIRFYEDESAKKTFLESLNQEQQSEIRKIREDMIERCKPSAEIRNEQDARKLFETHQCNDCMIFYNYNHRTIADFKKFASEEKKRVWTGENYTALLKKISGYTAPLSEEQYQQISKDCRDASYLLFVNNMDDSYEELTFTTIRNAWQCGVKSCDYAHLIEKFISKFIGTYPEKIENLRPLLHFLDEICFDPEQAKYFENLLFYRKELARLIEHRIWGFQFQLTTEEIREKIFAFLKSDSKCRYILH
ncbi:MAG: hypothetical protein K2O42_10305, partial [Oscillospiraceae bacterium]|nr:hypothetical protein [Oscillospiraceae bacterium]